MQTFAFIRLKTINECLSGAFLFFFCWVYIKYYIKTGVDKVDKYQFLSSEIEVEPEVLQ